MNLLSDTAPLDEGNLRSQDRVLSLAPIDGKPISVTGLIDKRLFTGQQQLHCKMDMQTNLWSFNYGSNTPLPEPLQSKFTSFSKAYDHAEQYFRKRNVMITEVKD